MANLNNKTTFRCMTTYHEEDNEVPDQYSAHEIVIGSITFMFEVEWWGTYGEDVHRWEITEIAAPGMHGIWDFRDHCPVQLRELHDQVEQVIIDRAGSMERYCGR